MHRLSLLALFSCSLVNTGVHANSWTTTVHDSVADSSVIWQSNDIPVCWENPEGYTRQTENVRKAITETWQKHSDLVFFGWEKCLPYSQGIRILVDPKAWPKSILGSRINGVRNGMILNFSYLGEYKCNRNFDECNRIIAVHEFGHALGFHHEQNRSDTDKSSACFKEKYEGAVANEYIIGPWDIDSVMNYCNPTWSGNGLLSNGDIIGVRTLYGPFTGFENYNKWSSKFGGSDGWTKSSHPRYVSDVNGDGKADLIGFADQGVWVSLSNGSGFQGYTQWSSKFGRDDTWSVQAHVRTVGDVNGDGKADLIGFADQGVWVSLSNGTGFHEYRRWSSSFGRNKIAGGWSSSLHPRLISDINGDGMADIVGFGDAGVYTALSNGNSFEPPQKAAKLFGRVVGGWGSLLRTSNDITGDGKSDVIGITGDGVYTAISNEH